MYASLLQGWVWLKCIEQYLSHTLSRKRISQDQSAHDQACSAAVPALRTTVLPINHAEPTPHGPLRARGFDRWSPGAGCQAFVPAARLGSFPQLCTALATTAAA